MIYLVIYSLFAVCCIPFQFKRDADGEYLDKFTTNWIRGIAILIIMIHHGVQNYDVFPFLYPFHTLGYGAVAVFLLLSGYGLGVQYQAKVNYLHGFLRNKLGRLYFTFWCAYLLMYLAAVIGGEPISVEKALSNLLTMSVLDTPTWYIKVQACLYVVFYLLFRSTLSEKLKISGLLVSCSVYAVACMLLGVKQYWWFTVLWFPVGVLLAYKKQTVERWLRKYGCMCFALSAVIMMEVVILRFFKGNMGFPVEMDAVVTVSFVLVIFALVYHVRFLSKPVSYIGTISLELYLIHSMLLTGYMVANPLNSVGAYAIYMVVSIGLSIIVKHLSDAITKLLLNKK